MRMQEIDWRKDVFKRYELMWVQRFYGDGQCKPPMCDGCKESRAIGLWQDESGKAYAYCNKCSTGSEPMIPKVGYRPTEFPRAQEI